MSDDWNKLKHLVDLSAENALLKAEVERLTAELSNISGWGRGLESDLSHARVEISFLKAEVERIEPELEQRCRELNLSLGQQAIQLRQIGELKAEVERLRKAGDALQKRLYVLENPTHPEVYLKLLSAWNAAKEGKQP